MSTDARPTKQAKHPKRWTVLQEVLEPQLPSALNEIVCAYDGAGFSNADYQLLGSNAFPVCKGICEVEPNVYLMATENGALHLYPSGKVFQTSLVIHTVVALLGGCYVVAGKEEPLAVHTPDTLLTRLQIRNLRGELLREIKCHFLSQSERIQNIVHHDKHCLVILTNKSLTVLDISDKLQLRFLKRTSFMYGPASISKDLIIAQRSRGLWKLDPATWNSTKIHHPCLGHIKFVCSTGFQGVYAVACKTSSVAIVRVAQDNQAHILQEIRVDGFVSSLASCPKTLMVATADGAVHVYYSSAPYTYDLFSYLTTHDFNQRVLTESEEADGPLTTRLFFSDLRLLCTRGGRLLGSRAGSTFLW